MAGKTALLVIDVQNIMFETPDHSPYEGEKVLKTIEGLIGKARACDMPIVYIQHTTPWEDSEFIKDSHSWLIKEEIAPQEGDTISLKYTYDAFCNTELHQKLQGLEIENLVICGLQSEVCVDTTTRSALCHGYKNILVGDGHTSYDSDVLKAKDIIAHHNNVLNRRFCKVMLAEEIQFPVPQDVIDSLPVTYK